MNPATLSRRILSIDLLRGLVMVIMALDHVRDFTHIHAFDDDPTNLATTTPVLFFTRFITHFCAPTFVFLSGTSIFLQSQRKTKKELSYFLFTRGLWLVLFEIVFNNLFWTFNPFYNSIALQVIWVIGISMLVMSAMIYLPVRVIFMIGLLIVCGHNYLDRFNYTDASKAPLLWSILHQPSDRMIAPEHSIFFFYPIIPWPAVMMLGYCLGTWFVKDFDVAKRKKNLLLTGTMVVLVFLILRFVNVYGDAALWSAQPRGSVYTVLSFFNVTKYPPSLLYLCVTIGPALIVLALTENWKGAVADFFIVFGRVPMFYYTIHVLLIHTIGVILFFISGNGMQQIVDSNVPFLFRPMHWGYPLWVVYLLWIIVIAILYPICKRYDRYKSSNKKWWLSYM
ncbi:MAG: DUF1624 domain-containing protein [Bacteroidota bacterium]|nr:DUF1624 domain-containing protein [Bacteroidota bacterium]